MKFSKKQGQEADVSILDELIGQCESAMVAPFKKKKKAVEIEVVPEEGSDEEEAAESPADEDSEAKDKPDLSDMDMSDLVELYKEIKARKGE